MRIIPNQNGSSLTRCMLLLVLMVTPITCAPPPAAAPKVEAIALPVDVGDINGAQPAKQFGQFPVAFATCGKTQTIVLNEGFKKAGGAATMNSDVLVHCEPEPGYVIQTSNDVTLDPLDDKSLLTQCQGLLVCGTATYTAGADSATTVFNSVTSTNTKYKLPIRPQSICAGKALSNKGKTIIANEHNCFKNGKHTFLKTLTGSNVAAGHHILPRWIGKQNQFNLGHRRVFRTPVSAKAYDTSLVFGFDNEVANANKAYKQCDQTCNKGRSLKFTFATGTWRAMVYLRNDCPSFRICLEPKDFGDNSKLATCKPGSHWDILVHAGAVVWPDHLGGSVIKMRPDLPSNDPNSGIVAVEIGYGVKVDKTEGELFVGNVYREFVMSDSKGIKPEDAAHISMHFPSDTCLLENGGVVSANIKEGRTYVESSATILKYSGGGTSGGGVDGSTAHTGVTEEVITPMPARASTTTVAPVAATQVSFASGRDTNPYNKNTSPTYETGKWWTWALYIGSILGTVLIMLPGTALFYVLRRTVFATWYRGMYKRYGCDASGTTGGITGVGFSDTTTGGITVGGTTGGGTTGSGTTNTMGGDTTGGDTTKTNTLAL